MTAKLKRIFITLITIASAFTTVKADEFSYIYIQGDKQIPFYVKLEGEMQPRYGKNYCIIPKLAPGQVNIEILFQQNQFPAEKFTILVPANGYRGFMLTQKDGAYSLYDLQQGIYLSPGNDAGDDVAPSVKQPVPVPTPVVADNTSKTTTATIKPKPVTAKPTPKKQEVEKPIDNGQPNFIDNIELNNERSFGTPGENIPSETANTTGTVTNSDCPKPLSRSDYEDVLNKAKSKSDANRLKYLLEQTDNCYSTGQVRALARTLTKDPERYAFLKQVYPHVTDQSNFASLESTLTSKEWKEYFKLILP
jgi:hypothetical protein